MASAVFQGSGGDVTRIDTFLYDERKRVKEARAKVIVLFIIGLLIAGYGAWNIWRMVQAVEAPVITIQTSLRSSIPVPGCVICGQNLDQPIQCFKSAFNAADDVFNEGQRCDEYLTTDRIDATPFVNMRGYYNLSAQICYVFNPSKPVDGSSNTPLRFDNNTQKVALALWSSSAANNTLGAITNDQWFFFGVFSENEDPHLVKFQIVKIPAISYLYVTRTEKIQSLNADAIAGGTTSGSGSYQQGSLVQIDQKFTSFAIEGFGISSHLWGLFRIIPNDYQNDTATSTQVYPVDVWYNRVEFTLLQLAANMGGFISILSALYFLLLGSRRVNPWGIVQRYILKTVPPPYTPTAYGDIKTSPTDIYSASLQPNINNFQQPNFNPQQPNFNNLQQPNFNNPQQPSINPYQQQNFAGGVYDQSQQYAQQSTSIQPQPQPQFPDDFDDPRIQRLRQELRAEAQAIITTEIAKLRIYLSNYFQDAIKTD